jgi:glucan biosynthesis protein C
LPWATQSVYPWYLLHQSLIVLLAYWLVPLKLGPIREPVLIGLGTVLGCWLLTSGLIVHSQWLRPLFGLKPLQRATATAPAGMALDAARAGDRTDV